MSDLTFFKHIFRRLGISWHRIGVCPVPEKSLVRYTDPCHCIYYLVRHDRGIFCAGPYCNAPVTMSQIHALCAAFSLGEDDVLEAVLAAVCDELFGEAGWASVTLDDSERETFPISSSSYEREVSRALLARIEKRYEEENRMLALVSSGDVEGIRTLLQELGGDPASAMEVRSADSLRNRKNYLVIANTLLRKAAEEGSVHPYYLDRLSSGFARQIEGARSAAACEPAVPLGPLSAGDGADPDGVRHRAEDPPRAPSSYHHADAGAADRSLLRLSRCRVLHQDLQEPHRPSAGAIPEKAPRRIAWESRRGGKKRSGIGG